VTKEMKVAMVSVILTGVVSYLIYLVTTKRAELTIIITDPVQNPGEVKVRQWVTVRSSGDDVAKKVNFSLKDIGARLEKSSQGTVTGMTVQLTPPATPPPQPVCGPDATCGVAIGDLQPDASALLTISYSAPPLRDEEINAFSDNAKVHKIRRRPLQTLTTEVNLEPR
jgi:hypothetical protein